MPVEGTELGGRFHFQFNSTSSDDPDEPTSEMLTRRARIWVASEVTDWIDAAVQVDIARGRVAARYAFMRFALSDRHQLTVGQFKRAFDLFQITSSSRILVIERTGNIRGVEPCSGVGGVCTFSRFAEQLEFSSLDIGALFTGESESGRLAYLVSVSNGSGPNVREENDAKSASARVEWSAVPGLRFGGNVGLHDYPNAVTGEDEYAPATSLDVEWGDWDGGLHLQAGVMRGANWRNLDAEGVESTFLTYQGIASYRFPVTDVGHLTGVEPIARVSWGDPDRATASDGGVLYTTGLQMHFEGRNKLAANIDIWRPTAGTAVWGLKLQSFVYF